MFVIVDPIAFRIFSGGLFYDAEHMIVFIYIPRLFLSVRISRGLQIRLIVWIFARSWCYGLKSEELVDGYIAMNS